MVTCHWRADKRRRVSEEAAGLIYTGQEKEYWQAKLQAAKTLGTKVLPSNAEIASALDRIAEMREGKARLKKLVEMRREALNIMKTLRRFTPLLVGSVWRGTAHQNSDIDIITYAENPREIVFELQTNHYNITNTEFQTTARKGAKRRFFHIYIDLPSTGKVEIVVHPREDINHPFKCEIYGDPIIGLTIQQLQQILKEDPNRKFVPS